MDPGSKQGQISRLPVHSTRAFCRLNYLLWRFQRKARAWHHCLQIISVRSLLQAGFPEADTEEELGGRTTVAGWGGKGCRMEQREQLNSNTVPGKASANPLQSSGAQTSIPWWTRWPGLWTPPWTTADSLILEGALAGAGAEGANGCRLSDDWERVPPRGRSGQCAAVSPQSLACINHWWCSTETRIQWETLVGIFYLQLQNHLSSLTSSNKKGHLISVTVNCFNFLCCYPYNLSTRIN